MKALSIRAPWWWFILHGGKDIENRDWRTHYRGPVLVHASKWWAATRVSYDAFEMRHTTTAKPTPSAWSEIRAAGGCIVGQVEIVDCVAESASPWFVGRHGFVLRNPVAFATPIPCTGALGFFNVPADVMERVKP